VLERQQAAGEVADACTEPDRRVAARGTDLEHTALVLRRDEREQELPRLARDLARALGRRNAARALVGVFGLEPRQNVEHALVEHGRSLIEQQKDARDA